MTMKQISLQHIFTVLLTLCLFGCVDKEPIQSEYGVFYMETQGDFVVPVGADAPAIYSWSTSTRSDKGDVELLWRTLGIKEDIGYSFSYVEVSVLNHLATQGWHLELIEISSTPTKGQDIRTAYRYIFTRNRV
jgi:hypothetical protein